MSMTTVANPSPPGPPRQPHAIHDAPHQTLAIHPYPLTPAPPDWRRCDSTGANCLDITGASETTYALVTADVGQAIRVREMASNAYGQSSAESAATGVIAGTPPAN